MMKKGGAKADNYEFEDTQNAAQCSVIEVVEHVPRLAPRIPPSAPQYNDAGDWMRSVNP